MGSGSCARVTRVRVAVSPDARLRGAPERLLDPAADDDAAERHVPRGDALRERDRVRIEPEATAGKPVADPPVAADHLVGDEEDPVVTADLPHGLEVAVGWEEDAARADDRLAEECSDVLRAELLNRCLERLGRVPGDPGRAPGERADADLERLRPDDAGPEARETVVGALPRDDRRALGVAEQAPVALRTSLTTVSIDSPPPLVKKTAASFIGAIEEIRSARSVVGRLETSP